MSSGSSFAGAAGQRVVLAEGGWIVLARALRCERLVRLADVPLTRGGRIGFEVENALAAAAAAWGMGLPPDKIRRGLVTFQNDTEHSPGRFNIIDTDDGATVILDFGHNPSALEALAECR